MRIAVIPARGGSKRVPRKNIRIVNHLPMIAWSIKAAKETNLFDRIIVSTDDLEISNIAIKYGAETPFIRPTKLSDDYSSTMEVVKHTIEWLLAQGVSMKEVCCIYATAPTIRSSDIVKGLHILNGDPTADFSFAVAEYPAPIQRALKINEFEKLEMFSPEHVNTRSQDLSISYYDAAQFYWGHTSSWLKAEHIFTQLSTPVIVPRSRAVDVDTEADLLHLETILKALEI